MSLTLSPRKSLFSVTILDKPFYMLARVARREKVASFKAKLRGFKTCRNSRVDYELRNKTGRSRAKLFHSNRVEVKTKKIDEPSSRLPDSHERHARVSPPRALSKVAFVYTLRAPTNTWHEAPFSTTPFSSTIMNTF